MAATQVRIDAAPFDGVADRYDDTFTFTRIGQAQRNAVWRDLATTFHSGERILEIGCGTGVDACFLAKRGVRVVACDSSSRMVAVTECRVHENRLQKLVQPLQLHAEDIQALQASERFGGAFSNFGALNCVEDMAQFADDLANLMKPGAKALLCWIGPFCLWETVWYLSCGRSKKAFRRFQRNVIANIGGGASLRVHYPTVRELAKVFAPQFRITAIRGIGVAVPPSYLESWAQRHPKLFQLCEKIDSFLGTVPCVRMLADHVLIEFERTDSLGSR